MMCQGFTFKLILISLAYVCVKSSPAALDVTESSETTKPSDEQVTAVHSPNSTVAVSNDNEVNNNEDDNENSEDHHYNTIYENYGLDDDIEDDDSEILSNSILSGIDKDNPETSLSLSDDVIIDALFTNIDTLQDQIELCEEGLRHKLLLISRKKLLNLESEDDDSYEDYTTLDEDYEQDDGNDTNNSNDASTNTLNTHNDKPTTDDDKKKDDDINEKSNLQSENNTVLDESSVKETRQKRCVTSDSDDSVHSTLADIVKNPGKAIVNRLSVRFEHLKNSLRECYVLYKSLE